MNPTAPASPLPPSATEMENLNAYWQACNYLAAAYPEGFYGEEYPDKIEDAEGVREFFKEFAFPDGIGSHCTPEIPG